MNTLASEAARLHAIDTEAHKDRAWMFWALSSSLTTVLVVAYPPTRGLGAPAGWTIEAVITALVVGYVLRLRRVHGHVPNAEVVAATLGAVVSVMVLQWLQGGYRSNIELILALHVFGGAGVLSGRIRALHLGLVVAAVMMPALYSPVHLHTVIAAGVWALVLAIQAGFLYDYGLRLRAHRLALLEAEREASRRAGTDALTGLGNRRAFERETEEVAVRAAAGEQFSVVYCDLDGFKSYNDHFGHAAGDGLLARLGAALAEVIEGRGQAYRIGGDEFCVIFDGALGGEDPLLVAVHAALSERGAQYAIEPSCGLVVLPHEAADGPSAVRLADERMYAAKHETRARLNRAARNVLAQALAEHSGMPGAPITELCALARSIATGLGLPPAETAGLVDGPAAPEAPDSRAVSVAA